MLTLESGLSDITPDVMLFGHHLHSYYRANVQFYTDSKQQLVDFYVDLYE